MIFFYRVRQAVDAWACNLFFWKKITFSSLISLVNLCRNCLMFKFTVRLSMPSPYILMLLSLTEVSEYAYVESCQDGKDWWFLVTFSAVPSMTQKLLKSVKGARASDASWNRFLHFVLLWHAATSEFIVPVVTDTPECTEEVAYRPITLVSFAQ